MVYTIYGKIGHGLLWFLTLQRVKSSIATGKLAIQFEYMVRWIFFDKSVMVGGAREMFREVLVSNTC